MCLFKKRTYKLSVPLNLYADSDLRTLKISQTKKERMSVVVLLTLIIFKSCWFKGFLYNQAASCVKQSKYWSEPLTLEIHPKCVSANPSQ